MECAVYFNFVVVEAPKFSHFCGFIFDVFSEFFIGQFAVDCDTTIPGLPVSTSQYTFQFPVWVSIHYSHIWDWLILLIFVCGQFHLTRLTVFQSSIISLM